MNTTYTLRMLLGLLLTAAACAGQDPAPSTDKTESDKDAVEESDPKPVEKDAGKSTRRDAGKVVETEDEETDDDEPAADPPKAVDAGKRAPADAGAHGDTPGAHAADAATTPVVASTAAKTFCDKYGMHCGYGKAQRHADESACFADFNANPAQQGCKIMHMDTAIAGTAAACNGMASPFCFSIHCLHAAGLVDPTGTTYCK